MTKFFAHIFADRRSPPWVMPASAQKTRSSRLPLEHGSALGRFSGCCAVHLCDAAVLDCRLHHSIAPSLPAPSLRTDPNAPLKCSTTFASSVRIMPPASHRPTDQTGPEDAVKARCTADGVWRLRSTRSGVEAALGLGVFRDKVWLFSYESPELPWGCVELGWRARAIGS